MYIIVFLFLFFFLLLFVALLLVGRIARFLSSLFAPFRSQERAPRSDADAVDGEEAFLRRHRKKGRKVFAADEGEYVDFQEIKDDAPERRP